MGRRKIEIQPITHERNRSVTFLKRKNGLFKKAYELGVLCSVDIAVIVFEERPGHHPKLYQYSSTDIQDIVQRHIRHQGEKDTKSPNDFANAPASAKFDDDEGDDDEPDDEEEYTPGRGAKRRKVKKSSRAANPSADPDFDNHSPASMAIPQPPMPSMHNASSLPVSSDRHAFREGTDEANRVASYQPTGPSGMFRPGYPSFFPHGHPGPGPGPGPTPAPGPGGFMPWDGRNDFARQRAAYEGGAGPPPPGGYTAVLGGAQGQGSGPGNAPGGPGNLFAFLEEQQRRAQQGGIEWPDAGHGQSQSPASATQVQAGSEWLDFLSPRNATNPSNPSNPSNPNNPAPASGGDRSTSSTAESWERGTAGLPPKLRGGSKERGDAQSDKKERDEGGRKAVNGKGVKKEG